MTIKEKLNALDVDIKDNKNIVDEIKKALLEFGEPANKITSKLSPDGERLVEKIVAESNLKVEKKQVVRPRTVRVGEEVSKNNSNDKNENLNKENEKNKNETVETTEKEQIDNEETNPTFWKDHIDNSKSNIKITFMGQEKKKDNVPANGRPLPQSTIDELKRKKEEAKKASENNKKQKDNNSNAKNNDKKQNNNNNNNNKNQNNNQKNKQNNSKQNNNNNNNNKNNAKKDDQNKNKQSQNNKYPNFAGKNVKTTFNQSNASIAIGTNNHFEGKKRDKLKFNKDYETKKQNPKNIKNKDDKYKNNLNNFENENNVARKKRKTGAGAFVKPEPRIEKPEDEIKSIVIPEIISIKDFATKLKLQPAVIVKKLFMAGKMVTPNTELSYEEAENIAIEYEILCEREKKIDVIAELLKETEENTDNMINRPPIVCVMGHVDHGKTSILDAIRKTNVISKEAGGITQHIGAYQVKIKDRLITFLDTPGHEAFTAMRLRGATSTDIAILVVAADDGVKPQTIEAISHARAAGVEILVAVNKVDKPEANVDRVKQQLAEYELTSADWGGQTTFCEVSAKQNIGIENLLEMVLLTADVMDLKANPNRNARGIVIESLLDKGKGPVARILVQKGTLHIGDFVAMGKSYGKVRAMSDCNGIRVKEATPSMPVEILGLNDVPQAGDTFICFDSEKEARSFADTFVSENKKKLVEDSKHKVTLDALFEQIKAGELKELNLIIKADVAGSAEAIKNSMEKLSNEEVVVKVIHDGVGNINESDVTLASASNAIIIGFNIKAEPNIKNLLDKEKVDLRLYNVIYNAIDDVEKAMKGMLAPVFEERVIGELVVRQIFKASNIGNIAGSYVTSGEVRRDAKIRLRRNDNLVFDGAILSLKRFKDEAKEVKAGFECGVVLDGFNDYNVDDVMEVYVIEEKKNNYE